jgi:fructose-1,6-bisphosphatase II
MLFNGEQVGDGSGPELDIAVDPVDGTTLTAKSLPDAISVLGVSKRGTMFDPGLLCTCRSSSSGLRWPGGSRRAHRRHARHRRRITDRRISDLTVALLDRPRHQELVSQIRAAGARIRFLLDGDVAGAIMAASPGTGIDLLVGTGGTPEGVLAACALRCLGGQILGRLIGRDDAERRAVLEAGYDLDAILTTTDLVSGDNVFFAATGVTDGVLLRGVRFEPHRVVTQSISMRSRSGTIRIIEGRHDPDRSC